MRRAIFVTALLCAPLAAAQPRDAGVPSGVGYSFTSPGARPRPQATATSTPPSPLPAAPNATVTVINARPGITPAAPSSGAVRRGPRGPGVEQGEGSTVSTVATDRRGAAQAVVAPTRAAAPASADAGVDESHMPTAGALFGGPLPGPSVAYMGVPVRSRTPPPAPPLAPGAVRPTITLPGSSDPPPGGAAPWVPRSTSGFQLGRQAEGVEGGGYGFEMSSGRVQDPGTIRNSP